MYIRHGNLLSQPADESDPRNRHPGQRGVTTVLGFGCGFGRSSYIAPPTLTRGTRCINARARGTVECIRLPIVAIRGWIACVRSCPHVLFWSREERLRNSRFLNALINGSSTLCDLCGCHVFCRRRNKVNEAFHSRQAVAKRDIYEKFPSALVVI